VSVIRWEEPPKHANGLRGAMSKFQAAADALRARPGEWAVIAEGLRPGTSGPTAVRIRAGLGPFAPKGSFEAKSIGPASGGTHKVYARYVGPSTEDGIQ
jgi:hypothetical protein